MREDTTATGTITALLREFQHGDRSALSALFPIIYDELRFAAHSQRRMWNGDDTMGTTALVHEVYLKLVDADRIEAHSRGHFLRLASTAMRQILCNYARDRRATRRGGGMPGISLDAIGDIADPISEEQVDALSDLDEALKDLANFDDRLASVIECRIFGGLSIDETAQALGVSAATVKRDWALARAWLYRNLTA